MLTKEQCWKYFKLYISIAVTIGFTMFIFEECMQTVMFANFSYEKNKDVEGLKHNIKQMEGIAEINKLFVYGVGWLNPIMFPAYLTYINANEQYIKSAKSSLKRMS